MIETIILIYFIYISLKIFISLKQISYVRLIKEKEPFLLEKMEYKKAGDYAISSEKLSIVKTFVEFCVFSFWILYGLKFLENNINIADESVKNLFCVMSFLILGNIFALPLDYYSKFVLDKKFGFNKSTLSLYITDQLKSLLLLIVFGSIIVYGIILFISTFSTWWIYSFLFLFFIIILINMIYPTLIAPIFNKMKPLENEELKLKIDNLLEKVNFKTNGVFVMDASKRDSRLNAYFGGLGKSKRVVLFDTLLEKIKDEELLAVLGHELGHFKNGDIYKNIGVTGLLLFLMFFIFGNIPNNFYLDLNLSNSPFVLISIFLLFSSPLSFFLLPLIAFMSRHNEYNADKKGSELGGKENLISALKKLVCENKSFPKSHPYYVFFYYTHPPIIQRLKELGEIIE